MEPRILLSEMTREQIRALAPVTVAVLPTASTEQHGPHLPVATDALICTALCQRAAESLRTQMSVTVAPPVIFGSSHHHFPYPGVLSLAEGTFTQVVREVCEGLARSGFRRIAIVNGHGGNDDAVRVAAREVAGQYHVSLAAASYWTIAGPALVDAAAGEIGAVPGHAGGFETSLVLALRPELVDQAQYPPALSRPPIPTDLRRQPTIIRAGQRIGGGPGYTDHPAGASAAHGERLLKILTAELARFLLEFGRS